MAELLLTDANIVTFEQTLVAEGYNRILHTYGVSLVMYSVWAKGHSENRSVWHIDGLPSGKYRASKRS